VHNAVEPLRVIDQVADALHDSAPVFARAFWGSIASLNKPAVGRKKGILALSEMVIPTCLLSLIACFARSATGFQVRTSPRFC